jgi:cyclase
VAGRSQSAEGRRRAEVGRAGPPKQTFDKSPVILKDDTREVRFYFFGWAHTRGDGFVYLPKEKVLYSGDAALNGPFNYTADANIANWPKVIAAAQKLDVTHVLPGHGGPGGKEILEGQARFMTELHSAVQAAVKRGKKLDDIVKKQRQAGFDQHPVVCRREELGGRWAFRSGARHLRRDHAA